MFTSVPTEQLHGSLLGRVRPHTGIQQESSTSLLRTVTTNVGETGRTIKTRLSEHRRNCRNREIERSGVAKHNIEEDHRIDWDRSTVER